MKILLAVDFSPNRDAIAGELAVRPWPAGTTVEVLSVVEPVEVWAVPELTQQVAQRTREIVRQTVDRLISGGLDATPLVLVGDPKAVIVDHARQSGPDLLAVGSQSATGLSRIVSGGVARTVLRHAPCSMEVVRPTSGSEPVRKAMKILLATDGSECSNQAARSIAERPWPAGSEVRVLSVVEPKVSLFEAAFEPPLLDTETIEHLRADSMKQAQDAVLAAREILASAGLPASESISVLLDGPKHVILQEASEWGADLIVVGSHGRRGVSRFLLGSVCESVAMHADCSVDVIRPAID
jgi:nucleotide-binding universal stress UspA family protein